jgi:cytochrome c-type biogenesis protein CcmH/NrfG
MAALLALYLLFAVYYGLLLIASGDAIGVAIGIALLVLPAIAAAAMVGEFVFAFRAERLARRLEAADALPDEQLPLTASGRVERAAADEVFPRYQEEVERNPDDWRAWFRLALAYDASGDRRRARWATRRAIRLSRETPEPVR